MCSIFRYDYQKANNKGADQSVRMCRLVCTFVVHKHRRQGFSRQGPSIFFSAPANFNSGVSIRVARRSEMLEKISSGYGKVISVFIWVLSLENMFSGFPTK